MDLVPLYANKVKKIHDNEKNGFDDRIIVISPLLIKYHTIKDGKPSRTLPFGNIAKIEKEDLKNSEFNLQNKENYYQINIISDICNNNKPLHKARVKSIYGAFNNFSNSFIVFPSTDIYSPP